MYMTEIHVKVVFSLKGEIYRWNVRLEGYDTPN